MSQVGHQRDSRVSIIWGNVAAPVIAGSPTTSDWDKTTSLTTLTSKELPVEGFTFFTLNQNNRRVNRQTGLRHRTAATTWVDMDGAIPGVTLGMPATQENIDLFVFLAMQRCTAEGGTTPFVKNFEFPANTTAIYSAGSYPDFEGNNGAFCGLVFSNVHTAWASKEEIMMGCVPTELRITCQSDQHDGQLWLEADMIGRYMETGVTYTGTITNATEEDGQLFHINDMTIKTVLAVTGCPIYGFGLTITTGAAMVPFGGVGAGSVDCKMALNASGYIDFLANDTGVSAFDNARAHLQAQAGSALGVSQLGWTSGSGDTTVSTTGELLFTFRTQPTALVPVGSEEYRFRVDFDCYDTGVPGTIVNDALKIDLANALDRGW